MPQTPLQAAESLFTSEVATLTAASANGGLAPELVQAYRFLSGSGREVWALYADKGLMQPRLQYLYSVKHCLRVILQAVGLDVNYAEAGVQESLSDEGKHFLDSYNAVAGEITLLETQIRGSGGVVFGRMTTTTPEPIPPWRPNPGSGYYRGDPTCRSPWFLP